MWLHFATGSNWRSYCESPPRVLRRFFVRRAHQVGTVNPSNEQTLLMPVLGLTGGGL